MLCALALIVVWIGMMNLQTRTTRQRLQSVDAQRSVVDVIPEDIRIMLTNANLDGRQLTLRGQTAEHRDAERIVEAVNRIGGWTANPPRTTRLKTEGVEFSILATADATLQNKLSE